MGDLNFNYSGFSGGMNLLLEPTRIAANEYIYAHNVRIRGDALEPTKNHLLCDAPEGLKQGLYAFGDFLILFVDGLAYYRDVSIMTWTLVPGFVLAEDADRIYACAVPASTMNFGRNNTTADDATAPIKLDYAITTGGLDSGLVCQDGTSQPYLIYLNAGVPTGRELDEYADWDAAGDREYVPIGTKMVFHDGVLYLLDPTETILLRSVTGRPLDFVVNIETTGDKGGDAYTTKYVLSNVQVTCFVELNTESLFVSTSSGICFAVTPDRTRPIFGEPQFIRTYLFNAQCINQFSFVDILGDFGFIDPEGLRSFNAVLQQQNEGRNSVLSDKVAKAFGKIKQDPSRCAAIIWNNYAIFAVQTAYGRNLLVYDTLYKTFTSFDFNNFGSIKQFAVTSGTTSRLFAITTNDQLIECYGGTDYALAIVKTREGTTGDPGVELKTEGLRAAFLKSSVAGTATATLYIDGATRTVSHGAKFNRLLAQNLSGLLYPVTYPALWGRKPKRVNVVWPLAGAVGFTVGYLVRWTGGATLTHMSLDNSAVQPKQAQTAQSTQR